MTLKIFESTVRGSRAVKAVAVINKSVQSGIPGRRQKTFTIATVAPKLAIDEMRKSFEAAAARWEQKTMEKLKQQQTEQAHENTN